MDNAEQGWRHTFHIKLPYGIKVMPHVPECFGDAKFCPIHDETVQKLKALQMETDASIKSTVRNIKLLIPEIKNSTRYRRRSSVLPWMSGLLRVAFGTAEDHDVQHILKHNSKLQQQNQNLGKAFQQQEKELASFMEATDQRMENAIKGIELNHQLFNNITRSLQHSLVASMQLWAKFNDLMLKHLKNAQLLELRMQQLAIGVQAMIKGKLSPFLIPVSALNATLNQVQMALHKNYPEFHIANTKLDYYYDTLNVAIGRTGNTLVATISIPITSSSNMFKVYEVLSFPVPLNQSTTHASQLLNTAPYFAVSSNHFIEISRFMYSQCAGDKFKHCSIILGQQNFNNPTCLSAIFYKLPSLVKQLCDFRFLHSGLQQFILELEPGKVLLSSVPSVNIQCANKAAITEKGCTYCVFEIPCHCTVKTGIFELPARINNCHFVQSQITKLYPVNLGLLQHFFDEISLNFASGDTLYDHVFNASIPHFQLFEHKFSKTMALDQKLHLSLKHMADSAKNNSVIYQSLVDPIVDGQWKESKDVYEIKDMVNTFLIAGVLLSYLVSGFTAYKLYKYAIIINTLAGKAHARGVVPPNLVWTQPHTVAPTVANVTYGFSTSDTLLYVWLSILSFLIVLMLIVWRCNKFQKIRKGTKIVMNVSNGDTCVDFTVGWFSRCPHNLSINFDRDIKLETSRRFILPRVIIDWKSSSITCLRTTKPFTLPTFISFGPCTAYVIKSLLNQPYHISFFTVHHGHTTALLHPATASIAAPSQTPKIPNPPQQTPMENFPSAPSPDYATLGKQALGVSIHSATFM